MSGDARIASAAWVSPPASDTRTRALRNREDALFRTLFLGGQVVAAVLCGTALLAGPFEPLHRENTTPAIQIRFEQAPEPTPLPGPAIVPSTPPQTEATPEVAPPKPTKAEPKAEATPDPTDLVGLVPNVPPDDEADPATPARPVYGVRTVLAHGIGAGSASGEIVSRRGNVLNGDVSSAAEDESEVGSLVSISSVDAAPEPIHRVLPAYTDEMRRARASGVVTARLLIDRTGRVREVEILSDFGMGSAELARQAFEQFRFRPASRDGEPVSVRIVHKIRFEFQG
ncbi:MAG: TonB family protein [Candidatus Eisenbacteria bacterium]